MRIFSNRWVQAGLAAVVVIGVANLLAHGVTIVEPTPEERAAKAASTHCTNGSTMARRMAQDAIRDDLLSPRSASFSDERVIHVGDCRLEVAGHVYAQNTFGAEIRSFYVVSLQYHPESDTWDTLDVMIQ